MKSNPPPVSGPALPLREWAHVHTELAWIYDHAVSPSNRQRPRTQDAGYRAWFIRKGQVRIKTGQGQNLRASQGQWIFLPSCRWEQHFSEDARILSLHFHCQWSSGENIFSKTEGLVLSGSEYPELEERSSQLEQMVRRHLPQADTQYYSCFTDYEHFLSFHTVFLQWLALWFNIQKKQGASLTRLSADDDRLLRAVRCLNEAPLSGGFPITRLCQESGLGDAHLNRLFLAAYGLSIRKSWEQRRLGFARTCLETSRMPIKEVAYRLGFKSDSHFMMWFKLRTGKRPKEYRQSHRQIG